jgi:hypothetical protein
MGRLFHKGYEHLIKKLGRFFQMICPTCSSKAFVIFAWSGHRRSLQRELSIFSQYQCQLGHYFETLTVFEGEVYEEHYTPSQDQKLVIRASLN